MIRTQLRESYQSMPLQLPIFAGSFAIKARASYYGADDSFHSCEFPPNLLPPCCHLFDSSLLFLSLVVLDIIGLMNLKYLPPILCALFMLSSISWRLLSARCFAWEQQQLCGSRLLHELICRRKQRYMNLYRFDIATAAVVLFRSTGWHD
eukprot:GILJ01006247.1.p3 GENE.GILJ01006247.1~~GILJ01006247.1.p3  ORF type:complete len:150 (+),score=11.31 GILJ01006247.1:363-812(+)